MILSDKFQFFTRHALLPFQGGGTGGSKVLGATETVLMGDGRLEIPMLLQEPVEGDLIVQDQVIPLEVVAMPKDTWLYGVNLLGNVKTTHVEVLGEEEVKMKGRLGLNLSEEWKYVDADTFYVAEHVEKHGRTELRLGITGNEGVVDVCGEMPLNFRIWTAAHRCRMAVQITELDEHGKRLRSRRRRVPGDALGGTNRESYAELKFAYAPDASRRKMRIELIKSETDPGEADSYCFFFDAALYYGTPRTEPSLSALNGKVDLLSLARYDAYRFECNLSGVCEGKGPETLHARVVERKNHEMVLGSLRVKIPGVSGELHGIDGKILTGSALRDGEPADEVAIAVDGSEARRVAATRTEHGDRNSGFIFEIPPLYLDGGVHIFELIVSGIVASREAFAVPHCQTPYQVLQEYATNPLPVDLAPVAKIRYDSLAYALRKMRGKAFPENYAELEAYIAAPQHAKPRAYPKLSFAEIKEPDVSVIIPVHNKIRTTMACLCALRLAWNDRTMEIIVVDDGSSDETILLDDLVPGIRVVRRERASGFVEACQAGAEAAQGRYLMLLNNDTEPLSGWLDRLVTVFERHSGIGVVGSKLIYPDGRLQEAGGVVWKTADPWNYGRLGNIHDPRYNYLRQADYVSGAALMVTREVWDEVGGFSPEFIPAYFEDTDLCFKVRAAGYKVVYCPGSRVIHYEGVSNGTDVSGEGMKRFQEINRPKFKRKWLKACKGSGEVGVELDLHKDRGIEYRALVLDAQHPRPDQDAGSYAAVQEMRLLQSLGFKLTFAYDALAYFGKYTEALQDMGVEVLYAPFISSVEEVLRKRGSEFDLIYVTRYSVALRHLPLLRELCPEAKVVLCNADLHFLRELREAIHQNDASKLERSLVTRDEELQTMREVDLVLSYNEVEHSVILSHNLDSTVVAKCPWVVDCVDQVEPFEGRSGIGFLGNYSHPPNEEAVRYFLKEIFPEVRRCIPGVTFHIFGAGGIDKMVDLEEHDVILEGFVEDLADLYQRMRVFVCPLKSGAGIKGKLINCLAYGLPSVVSPVAVEGTGIGAGNEAHIAERTSEWVEFITELYGNEATWNRMSEAAQRLVRRKYGFEAGREGMRDALETVGFYHPLDHQPLFCERFAW